MNGKQNHCSEDRLLDYIEGGVGGREQVRIKSHLEECWSCRRLTEDLEAAILQFTRFRDEDLLPSLPPPPREWRDLASEFLQIETGARTIEKRSAALHRLRGPAALVAIGGLAAATLVVTRWQHDTPKPQPAVRVALSPTLPIPLATRSAPPPPPAVTPPRNSNAPASADANTEVRIFAALHRLRADTGEPVEVEFEQGGWQVSAVGLSASRAQELLEQLRALPNVRLVLNQSGGLDSGQPLPAAPPAEAHSSKRLVFEEQLDAYFGSRAALVTFTNRALDHSEAMLARAHALRNLDRRFPQAVETGLGAEERGLLGGLRHDHRQAIQGQLAGFEQDFSVLQGALGLADVSDSASPAPMLELAQRWDHLLAVVLGGAATGQSPAVLKASLSAVAADMRRAAEELR